MALILCKAIINEEEFRYRITQKKRQDGTALLQNQYIQEINGCQIEVTETYDAALMVSKISATFVNHSDCPIRLSCLELGTVIESRENKLHYFTASWGNEFTPHTQTLDANFSFGSHTGRSCCESVPFAGIEHADGFTSLTLGWSGCWDCSILTQEDACEITIGIASQLFVVDCGQTVTAASVYLAQGKSLDGAALEMRRYFQKHISLLDETHFPQLPVETNTWWVYEDKLVEEESFLKNNTIAKDMGCTHAMLDAGWFGEESKDSNEDWFQKRGDWDVINTKRFPSGMKALCQKAEQTGIHPGIWCEIEAVGKNAKLLTSHPQMTATHDGESLGYLCFGNEETRTWAMSVMDQLIGEYGATWIKLDFNLDPAPGCNAKTHGHGTGDGLYAHYLGYYQFLDEVRQKYPAVILENCASGGQRMDIEMLSHTHVTHLSDPDFTAFHLQCYWGALSYLHQSACLHFSWSEVTFGTHNCELHNPISEDMDKSRFDFMMRAVLMGVPGFSYDFTKFPAWCKQRLAEHIAFYQTISNDFIRYGDAFRLTPQPLKSGGERFPVFQFNSAKGESLVFAFRLEGAPEKQQVCLQLLQAQEYEVRYYDTGETLYMTGEQLCSVGIPFRGLLENASEIVMIIPLE